MSNQYFDFKRFRIEQDRCSMKVGTDGVLLGAWFPMESGFSVLDVGTGTGLVALMAAQRGAGSVTAVEIDPEASQQALRTPQTPGLRTGFLFNVLILPISPPNCGLTGLSVIRRISVTRCAVRIRAAIPPVTTTPSVTKLLPDARYLCCLPTDCCVWCFRLMRWAFLPSVHRSMV